MDPIAFATAQLDKDEARARRVQVALDDGWNYFDETPTELIMPARALREVEGKRLILAAHVPDEDGHCCVCITERVGYQEQWDWDPWPCLPVRAVLLSWAGHPDYDQAWRPADEARQA